MDSAGPSPLMSTHPLRQPHLHSARFDHTLFILTQLKHGGYEDNIIVQQVKYTVNVALSSGGTTD